MDQTGYFHRDCVSQEDLPPCGNIFRTQLGSMQPYIMELSPVSAKLTSGILLPWCFPFLAHLYQVVNPRIYTASTHTMIKLVDKLLFFQFFLDFFFFLVGHPSYRWVSKKFYIQTSLKWNRMQCTVKLTEQINPWLHFHTGNLLGWTHL